MTIFEAKEFLIDFSKQWNQPKARIEEFNAWQRHASDQDLQTIDEWHKAYLSHCAYPLSTDNEMLQRNNRWLLESIEETNTRPKARTRFTTNKKSVLRMAAVFLVIIGAGLFFWFYQNGRSPLPYTTAVSTSNNSNSINPGDNKAILTLANGQQILLDSKNKDSDINSKGFNTKQLSAGILVFNGKTSKELVFNTLHTPVGGQYQIILPDGSHVWLNSNSSLNFPDHFATNKREVQFTGEAYFEITPNKNAPFIVKTDSLNVKVLGTGFNIMAYKNERLIKTTLVHGSIDINNGVNEKLIEPGEQAIMKKGQSTFSITYPNIKQEIAWKDGNFWFNKTSIYNIMRQIQRWYNIKVEYKGDLSQIALTGILSKKQKLTDLLSVLEATQEVQFKLDHDIITVSPYSN